MRAPAISISTSHKMISLWGKLSTNSNMNEEAGKPDFQDGQAKQPPGPPSEPGTDTGPKSDDGQGPKKDAENTVHAYLPGER